jgi:hypothetical protein
MLESVGIWVMRRCLCATILVASAQLYSQQGPPLWSIELDGSVAEDCVPLLRGVGVLVRLTL